SSSVQPSSEPASTIESSRSPTTESSSSASSITPSSSSAVAGLYSDYNTNPLAPDNSGMESTAVQIASKIKLGFNFGNTLEATGGETAWGNPMITEAQMKLVKDSGFDAIRLPVA